MDKFSMIIDFKGELTFKIIGLLINELNAKKDQYNIDRVFFKKLISLMIEVLENILKYSENFEAFIKDNPAYQPEFQVSCNGNIYIIHTRNPVKEKDILPVKQKIDLINNLNPDEIRILYRKTLCNGEFTDKGGAGLGFFEMIKITGQPIQYNFTFLSRDFSDFELLLHIGNKIT